MKKRRFIHSLNNAIDGIVHGFSTERHLKVHFVAATLVLVLCLVLELDRLERLVVIATITVVLVAEMLNTAIEALVDMHMPTPHPLARVAKDVAAGAVLLASANALVTAYLVLWEPLVALVRGETARQLLDRLSQQQAFTVVVAFAVVFIVVLIGKALRGGEGMTRGGLVSGHAAAAFAASTAILVVTGNPLATALAFVMALLVAHSRIEANVHRWMDVVAGALVGITTSLMLFALFHGWRTP